MIEIAFWAALFMVCYPYFVYPVVLPAVARLLGRPSARKRWTPTVSVLIPVFNEEDVVARKVENTLTLDYPPGQVEVVVGSDGSTDGTVSEIERVASPRLRLFDFSRRRGKPSVLADLATAASGEILVLTDASAMLEPVALRQMVESFGSDDIGVVSGEMIPDSGQAVESSMGFYRRSDNRLRRLESQLHSSTGAAGALYGIRRELFSSPPPNVILDDLLIPLRCVLKGYRVLICPEARFSEVERTTLKAEFRRKVRTLAGNYQALNWLWRLLIPGLSPIWFPLLSHKYLRLLTPFWMILLLVLNVLLLPQPTYALTLALQVGFYGAAGIGYLLRHRKRSLVLFHLPFLFVTMQVANLCAPFLYMSGRITMRWRRTGDSPS